MSLDAGTGLGPYEILAPLGAGGMGEVYRARDTRLDRIVAIKVAKEQFSERFEREARAVAALNHPHICQLYDVGPNYLVMELVEGTPLKGPLALDKAIEYAGQILDALDAAHKKGITHRDLKPANILVTKQGIKLLDFGLAKQTAPLNEADVTRALTGQGQILGTLQYMSPEQLQGKEVDARSDLFSFGCVLYEMLTGKRAFEGSNPASVIAAILEREPAPLEVARPLDRVVRRSLAKDPDQRFQTARDLKAALSWVLEQTPQASSPSRSRLAWLTAALAIIAIIAGAGWWRATLQVEQPLKPLVRLDVDLGPDVSLGSDTGGDIIISADGTRLAYVSHNRLFTRQLDQAKATELAGTEGAYAPFFSPDGRWIAFFAPGRLKKISVEGGAAIPLSDCPGTARGGSWGDGGEIIAALTGTGGLSRIPANGGVPVAVTERDRQHGEITHRWPQILPGGNAVLFTAHTAAGGFDGANVEVMSLADHRRKTLQRGGTYGRYLPSGHLIYINQGTLFAVPFDVGRLVPRGTPAPVLQQVAYSAQVGSAQLAFSQTGTLVYRSGGNAGLVTVQWLDGTGRTQTLLAKPGSYSRPRLSADGKRLALNVSEGSNQDLWVYELQRDHQRQLTFGLSTLLPIWSPDGRYIVFQGPGGMFWTRADGVGKPQALTQSKDLQFPYSFTHDGKRLAYADLNPATGYDIWTVPIDSGSAGLRAGDPQPFLQTPSDEQHPSFSPDGRWMAYASNDSGTYQVYVRAFPDNGGKWPVSNDGGAQPMWSRASRELFFRSSDNQIMVAGYTVEGDSFVPDKPRAWSEKRTANVGSVTPTADLALDGKRIAAIMSSERPEDQQARNHVIFLENFFDEVRRRAPVSKFSGH
jgi:Tol biopolymer transport system component/predicted Ser/Thr protein kinase